LLARRWGGSGLLDVGDERFGGFQGLKQLLDNAATPIQTIMALTCSGWTSDTVASAAFATDVDFDILGGYVKMSGWGASVYRSGTEVSTFFWV